MRSRDAVSERHGSRYMGGATATIVTTLGVALWSATAHAGEPSTSGVPTDMARVTLSVWIMPNAPSRNEERFMTLIRPFLQAHPHIRVVPTVLPWEEAWVKIRAAAKGGPAPDITQLGTTWTAAMASTGQLRDLSGTFDESAFLPQVLASTGIEGVGKAKGRRFSVPWFVDARALYYNKAACARAGVDPKTDFATWTSFKAALKKLDGVEVGGKRMRPFGMPAKSAYDALHDWSWWIWGAGGDFLSPDFKTATVASPASLAGIEFYISLYREGLMSRPAFDRNGLRVQEMLRNGEIATTMSIPIPDLPQSAFGVTLLPAGPKGRFTFLGGSALAVYKSSRHPEEAVALIKFLASESAQNAYSQATGFLPAAVGQYERALAGADSVRATFLAMMRTGRGYPSLPEWGAIEDVLRPGLGSLWDIVLERTGTYSEAAVRAELKRTAQKMDAELRSSRGAAH